MRRQGLTITINELKDLIKELEEEFEWKDNCRTIDEYRRFQINIINKTPKCSDTWEIETSHQVKKDKTDNSNEFYLETQTEEGDKFECMSGNVDIQPDDNSFKAWMGNNEKI